MSLIWSVVRFNGVEHLILNLILALALDALMLLDSQPMVSTSLFFSLPPRLLSFEPSPSLLQSPPLPNFYALSRPSDPNGPPFNVFFQLISIFFCRLHSYFLLNSIAHRHPQSSIDQDSHSYEHARAGRELAKGSDF